MDFVPYELRVQGPFALISPFDERRSLIKDLQHVCTILNRGCAQGWALIKEHVECREINR
jgi:hypothetical protein